MLLNYKFYFLNLGSFAQVESSDEIFDQEIEWSV